MNSTSIKKEFCIKKINDASYDNKTFIYMPKAIIIFIFLLFSFKPFVSQDMI